MDHRGLKLILQDLDAAATAAEAPWREKDEALTRYRSERTSAEDEASMQIGIFQSSLSEIEGKHKACQA